MADERRVGNLDAAAVLKPDHKDGLKDELSPGNAGKGSPAVSNPSRSSFVGSTSNGKGHLKPPVSYGSEALPCNSWGTTPSLSRNENRGAGTARPKPGGDFSRRYSGPINRTQEHYPSNNGPHYDSPLSAGPEKERHAVRNFSTSPNQRPDNINPQNGPTNYQPNGRIWNGKDTMAFNPNRIEEFEMRTELTRGPRSSIKSASPETPAKKKELNFPIRREQYNQKDFVVEYNDAKFFIIKSYSEDDIHKSIKYGVWTSTPNGNKRLDAAFRDAEARASNNGTECPIFLFFSVNGSGQFVGVAEMIGMVDFNKDMDFWRVDKWNGFFPVRWHIIKDVPNSRLRHIILENNYNKPVTFTRDTHEVELKQGLEMLNIFKNYDGKHCLLDDYKFYESKEKSLEETKKNAQSASTGEEIYKNNIRKPASLEEEDDEFGGVERDSNPAALIDLTRNLSLRESSI